MDNNSFYSSTEKHSHSPQPELPMKWHGFLIYFSLWASAVLNVISAFRMMSGSIYGDSSTAATVYRLYPSLKGLDIFIAIASIAIAIYAIYTRMQLAAFRRGAPGKLTILFIVNLAITLIYAIGATSITGISVFSDSVSTIISSIAMIVINLNYYGKRAHLFVN